MRYTLAFALAFAFCTATGGGATQAAPGSIVGTWIGNGTVKSNKTGRRETVRCRITYSRAGGQNYGLSATCASTAGKRRSGRGTLVRKGNRYSGRMSEGAISGLIVVNVRGKRQTLTATSRRGTARLSLRKR